MSLDDINKSLYDSEKQNQPQDFFDENQPIPKVENPFGQEQQWDQKNKLTKQQRRNVWIFSTVVLLIILVTGGSMYYRVWKRDAFHPDRVSMTFEGPKEVDSTQPTKYVIHYKNDNRVTLQNAEVVLEYAENFQPTNTVNLKILSPTSSKIFLGDIGSRQEGAIELTGIFYAPKDFPVYVRGSLNYIPSNGTSQVETKNQFSVNTTSSPVGLDLTAPSEVSDGDSVEYVIDYKNLDIKPLKDAQIRVEFPEGFEIAATLPLPSEGKNVWYVGSVDPNQGGKIRIKGEQKGLPGESKIVRVSIGYAGDGNQFILFNQREKNIAMVSPVLTISQEVAGRSSENIKAGDNLRFVIGYKNTGNIGLRNAIITVSVRGKILDFSKLKTDKGSFDGSKGIITWKASDLPGLANIEPGAGGSTSFTIPVKKIIPISSPSDKNYTVETVAKIDSPDIPSPIDSNKIIGSNKVVLKLNSKVLFDVFGYFNDPNIKNSGAIPPQVGKETTYTLHFSIANISNDLTDVVVKSSLPSGVRWTGKIFPSNEAITYDTRGNQLVWNVDKVQAGAGVIAPKKEISFQVGIVPQENQIGTSPILLNKVSLTAKDSFTGENVEIISAGKTTQMNEDRTIIGKTKVIGRVIEK